MSEAPKSSPRVEEEPSQETKETPPEILERLPKWWQLLREEVLKQSQAEHQNQTEGRER